MENQETITIQGTIELIKNEKLFTSTHMTEFVVSNKTEKRHHHYIVRSFSPGERDKRNIAQLIGRNVELCCFLNGRKSESPKGVYYNNELHVKEVKLLD